MATVKPPEDQRFWSSAGPMPEDMTPSEIRLSNEIGMLRREVRIYQSYLHESLKPLNGHTVLLIWNGLMTIAVLVKLFW